MKTLIDFIKNLKSFYRFYKDYEYNGDEASLLSKTIKRFYAAEQKL